MSTHSSKYTENFHRPKRSVSRMEQNLFIYPLSFDHEEFYHRKLYDSRTHKIQTYQKKEIDFYKQSGIRKKYWQLKDFCDVEGEFKNTHQQQLDQLRKEREPIDDRLCLQMAENNKIPKHVGELLQLKNYSFNGNLKLYVVNAPEISFDESVYDDSLSNDENESGNDKSQNFISQFSNQHKFGLPNLYDGIFEELSSPIQKHEFEEKLIKLGFTEQNYILLCHSTTRATNPTEVVDFLNNKLLENIVADVISKEKSTLKKQEENLSSDIIDDNTQRDINTCLASIQKVHEIFPGKILVSFKDFKTFNEALKLNGSNFGLVQNKALNVIPPTSISFSKYLNGSTQLNDVNETSVSNDLQPLQIEDNDTLRKSIEQTEKKFEFSNIGFESAAIYRRLYENARLKSIDQRRRETSLFDMIFHLSKYANDVIKMIEMLGVKLGKDSIFDENNFQSIIFFGKISFLNTEKNYGFIKIMRRTSLAPLTKALDKHLDDLKNNKVEVFFRNRTLNVDNTPYTQTYSQESIEAQFSYQSKVFFYLGSSRKKDWSVDDTVMFSVKPEIGSRTVLKQRVFNAKQCDLDRYLKEADQRLLKVHFQNENERDFNDRRQNSFLFKFPKGQTIDASTALQNVGQTSMKRANKNVQANNEENQFQTEFANLLKDKNADTNLQKFFEKIEEKSKTIKRDFEAETKTDSETLENLGKISQNLSENSVNSFSNVRQQTPPLSTPQTKPQYSVPLNSNNRVLPNIPPFQQQQGNFYLNQNNQNHVTKSMPMRPTNPNLNPQQNRLNMPYNQMPYQHPPLNKAEMPMNHLNRQPYLNMPNQYSPPHLHNTNFARPPSQKVNQTGFQPQAPNMNTPNAQYRDRAPMPPSTIMPPQYRSNSNTISNKFNMINQPSPSMPNNIPVNNQPLSSVSPINFQQKTQFNNTQNRRFSTVLNKKCRLARCLKFLTV